VIGGLVIGGVVEWWIGAQRYGKWFRAYLKTLFETGKTCFLAFKLFHLAASEYVSIPFNQKVLQPGLEGESLRNVPVALQ